MDDVLHKNIFNDRDLLKLSPDFYPSDITLRMQIRRNMFKDIHNHSFLKNSNWHRKSVKRMKDGYKVNKEIVKLRNDFKTAHLKNQLIMKSDFKHFTSQSELVSYDGLIDDIKYFYDDADKCIQELQEDMANLVLSNDSEFKINTKQRQDKIDSLHFVKKKANLASPVESTEHVIEHPIKIKCSYKSPKTQERTEQQDHIEDNQVESQICEKHTENELPNAQIDDLQTLLIMMAISKSSDDSESQSSPISSENRNQPISCNDKVDVHTVSANSNKGDVTKALNITPIRIEMDDRQTYLAKKYLIKWQNLINKKKEEMNRQRQETLNNFFDKLSKKKMNYDQSPDCLSKAKLLARDYNTYHHRYKVQKHIIALQKAKLEEQNRVIEELKYNRIIEASRESVDAMKEQVRKTYFEIDRQLKPKIKCLTNELKLHEIEEPALVLHCLKVPKFLQRMEKRAREREEKHAMIRERRIQMEEERIRLKQQAELARAEMDKEEKIKRMKELREKRKKEKIENIRKKQYAARLRALIVMADLHYEKCLMNKYGIRPFRMLLQIKRENMLKAKLHYNFQLQKNIFLNWMWYTEDMWFERYFIAEDYHRKKLLAKCFKAFKRNVHSYTLKKQVAVDYYDLYVTQLVFRKFREAIEIIKKENEAKWQIAVKYHNSNIMFKIFVCWRTLPALNALKREQEARKARWREKVLLVVPDYTPPDD